ncbi:MAG: pyruvate, water dikinase regulatory protein [Candidatus Puniceispirillaceae bacterium]
MKETVLHLHLISDSTGETVHQNARAALSQFPNTKITEHIWTLVRTKSHIEIIDKELARHPGVVLYSVMDAQIRAELEKVCRRHSVPSLSILDEVVDLFSRFLGTEVSQRPGAQHKLDDAYFKRMAAVEFAVTHDDGMNMDRLHEAEILLVGVSRTSKTPTSMYLAHRGFRVANYALVPHLPFPEHYLTPNNLFVIGLVSDPRRLVQIRKNRLQHLSDDTNIGYADISKITDEMTTAKRLFHKMGWPVLDVTRRSIEETAAAIIHLYNQWRDKQMDEEK